MATTRPYRLMQVLSAFKQAILLPVFVLALVAISGCAGLTVDRDEAGPEPALSWSDAAEPQTVLGQEISRFLETAPAGAVYQAATSPWGHDVEITVAEAYAAASGRPCRWITVRDQAAARPLEGIVCRAGAERWVAVRPVARRADPP